MKTVYLVGDTVREVIPEYGLPAGKWYSAEFASHCVEAPDEVEQGWTFKDGQWSEPSQSPSLEPTRLDVLQAQVTYTAMKTGTLIPGGEQA